MRRYWTGAAVLAVVLAAAPLNAAEVEKYLPADSEVVMSFNVRQFLDSSLVKKHFLEEAKKAIASNKEAQEVLNALGLDILKDVTRLTVASPGAGSERGLFVLSGKFDPAKINEAGEKAAKDKLADKMKVSKDGDRTIFEITGGQQPMFAAVADGTTILASSTKDQLKDALKAGGEKPKLKKDIADLIEKADDAQTMWLVVSSSVFGQLPLPLEKEQKDVLDKIESMTGMLKVADDVELTFKMGTKDGNAASELNKMIDQGLQQAKAFAPLIAAQKPQLAPVVEMINSIKSDAKEKSVVIKAGVSASFIEKALKKDN